MTPSESLNKVLVRLGMPLLPEVAPSSNCLIALCDALGAVLDRVEAQEKRAECDVAALAAELDKCSGYVSVGDGYVVLDGQWTFDQLSNAIRASMRGAV